MDPKSLSWLEIPERSNGALKAVSLAGAAAQWYLCYFSCDARLAPVGCSHVVILAQ